MHWKLLNFALQISYKTNLYRNKCIMYLVSEEMYTNKCTQVLRRAILFKIKLRKISKCLINKLNYIFNF